MICLCHIDLIRGTILDALVQSHMRKDQKKKEMNMNNKVEGVARDELRKDLEEEMKWIDKVEGEVLGALACDNTDALEDVVILHLEVAKDLRKLA